MVRLDRDLKSLRTTLDARMGIIGDDGRGQLDFDFVGIYMLYLMTSM